MSYPHNNNELTRVKRIVRFNFYFIDHILLTLPFHPPFITEKVLTKLY